MGENLVDTTLNKLFQLIKLFSFQALSSIDDSLKDLLLASKVLSDYLMNVDAASAGKIKEDLGTEHSSVIDN